MSEDESDFLKSLRAELAKDEKARTRRAVNATGHRNKDRTWLLKIRCPKCNSANQGVYDTRQFEHGRQRKRKCKECPERWTTIEIPLEVYADLIDPT